MAGFSRLPDSVPVLRGQGVLLRAYEPRDFEAWLAWANDPEVYGPTSETPPSRDELASWIPAMEDYFAAKQGVRWVVVPEGAVAAGTIGYNQLNERDSRGEIGYVLARSAWGRGLATEAARAVIAWGRDELGLSRIEATVMVGNVRSARVLEKLGFQQEGTLRSYKNVRGERRDYWMFGLCPERDR